MRPTIHPSAIILTKACRVTVSIIAKGSIVAWVMPLKVFLILTTQFYVYADIMQ